MFGLHDQVRIKNHGRDVWNIEKIHGKMFWIVRAGKVAMGQFRMESDLELVEKAKDDPDASPKPDT